MKTLIVYYSRTGTTKTVAELIQKGLNCDIEELIDTKNRMGLFGYILGGRDAIRKIPTVINKVNSDASKYDLIILGTPDWGSTMAPALRTYILDNKDKFKNIALFCTAGGSHHEGIIKEMGCLSDTVSIASIGLRTKEVKSGEFVEKINTYVDFIKKHDVKPQSTKKTSEKRQVAKKSVKAKSVKTKKPVSKKK
ncbi:MAG: flavodoxin [Candidatus Woesearchaeota archaeon]|jgi:flavodoxin